MAEQAPRQALMDAATEKKEVVLVTDDVLTIKDKFQEESSKTGLFLKTWSAQFFFQKMALTLGRDCFQEEWLEKLLMVQSNPKLTALKKATETVKLLPDLKSTVMPKFIVTWVCIGSWQLTLSLQLRSFWQRRTDSMASKQFASNTCRACTTNSPSRQSPWKWPSDWQSHRWRKSKKRWRQRLEPKPLGRSDGVPYSHHLSLWKFSWG